MAYIRPCNKCGQRISMREMRAGQWVAFDASTQTPHKCGKKTKADPNIKKEVEDGANIIILSDRGINKDMAPMPMLLACAFVHHGMMKHSLRSKFGIIIESAEPREPHHFAALFGYGASAINPYMVNEIIDYQVEKGAIKGLSAENAIANFNKALRIK